MPEKKKKLAESEGTKQEVIQEVEEIDEKTIKEDPALIKKEAEPIDVDTWKPKTAIGKKVKNKEITDIDVILDKGYNILEPEIVDILLPDLTTELLLVGQSKGKFGGGQRRVFRQTQKKTSEGNKPHFATMAAVGNMNGYIGIGSGKSKETVPAREKAIRSAKLNIMKIKRGCGSWECGCKEAHTIPYRVRGKTGSVIIDLKPAPKGTGLRVEKECAKLLKLAGIKDVWSETFGKTTSKFNLLSACMKALKQLIEMKTRPEYEEALGAVEGKISAKKAENGIVKNE